MKGPRFIARMGTSVKLWLSKLGDYTSRTLPRLGLAAVLGWVLGCIPPAERTAPAIDLAAELPGAEVTTELRRIELVQPSLHLVSGWGQPETDPRRDRTFLWSVGDESRLRFPVLRRRDLQLVFEGRPVNLPGAPDQVVTVLLNGRQIEAVPLRARLSGYRVRLPGDALVEGDNELRLRYAHPRARADLTAGARDRRPVAVAFYSLGFDTGEPSSAKRRPPPMPVTDGRLLHLPFGVQVDYFLPLGPRSELRFESWALRGHPEGRLEVLALADGDGEDHERLLRRLGPDDEPEAIPIFEDRGEAEGAGRRKGDRRVRLVRLRLRVTAPGLPSEEDGAVLVRPQIWSPLPAAGPENAGRRVDLPPRPRPPSVLVYLVDTLRADHLGIYNHLESTPSFDAFGRDALIFDQAVAQSSWTRSSVASILTGRRPLEHGALRRNHKLGDVDVTLAEILRGAGFATAAFVTNPNVTEAFGFGQGFDDFTDLGEAAPAGAVTEAGLGWIDARLRSGEAPFFLHLHTIDPHSPYAPPADYRRSHLPDVDGRRILLTQRLLKDFASGRREATAEGLAQLRRLYRAEIAYNDEAFGALIAGLKARDLYDGMVILVVSDHGEELDDHGRFEHGKTLYVESVRVPMLLRPPGLGEADRGRRVREPVQHLDILPTLLALLDLPSPPGLGGRDLLAPLEPVPIVSYLHLDGPPRIAVRHDGWKLIQRIAPEGLVWPQLFDLTTDPGETVNLAARRPVRLGCLASMLRRHLASADRGAAETVDLDEGLRRRLEALGYVP